MLQIIKRSRGKFTIFAKDLRGSEIDLDFNPFVEEERLTQGIIFHLRARPPHFPSCWTYGFYNVAKDEYLSAKDVEFNNVSFTSCCLPWLPSKPTHVLIIRNAVINYDWETGIAEVFEPANKFKLNTVDP